MAGPYGPRRVTYADYTASGRALALHRGLHPRRGAAALRQHPHRVVGHRPADDPAARGRAPDHPRRGRRRRRDVRDLLRLGRHRRDRQADRHPEPAAAGRSRRPLPPRRQHIPADERPVVFIGPVRAPLQRAAVARVDRRRRRPSPRTPTATSTSPQLEAELVALRRPAAEDRLVLGRVERHRHRLEHLRASPTCCTATARCRSGTSPPPAPYVDIEMNPQCAEHPLAYKDAVFLCPHKFVGGPGTPGVLVVRRELLHEPRARRRRRRHGRLRQPARSTATSTTRCTARRAARRRSSSRSAPGSCSSSSRRSASTRSARTRRPSGAARSTRWAAQPEHRDPRQPRGRAAVDRVVRRAAAGRPLPAPQLRRRAAQRPVRHPVARRLLVRRPVRPPAARHRHRALARVRARDRPRLRGDQARLGARQLQLLHLRDGVPTTSSTPSTSSPTHGWTLLPDYRFDPVTGLWRHRGRRRSSRRCACRRSPTTRSTGALRRPALPNERAPESALAGYLDEARRILGGGRGRTEDAAPHAAVGRVRAPALVRPARGLPDLIRVETECRCLPGKQGRHPHAVSRPVSRLPRAGPPAPAEGRPSPTEPQSRSSQPRRSRPPAPPR